MDRSVEATEDKKLMIRGGLAAGALVLAGFAALFATAPENTSVVIDHAVEGSVLSAGGDTFVEFTAGVTTECTERDDKAVVSAHVLLVTTTEVEGVSETRGHFLKDTEFNPYDGTCEEAITDVYADQTSVQGMLGYVADNALVRASLEENGYRGNDAPEFLEAIQQAVADGVPVVRG